MTRKMRITSRSIMLAFIEDSPLKRKDKDFMQDVIDGLSYKELERKYEKSERRIAQWKRAVFEQLHEYEYENIRK